jgi:predicted DNA-binding transcriptional regulator AlpA
MSCEEVLTCPQVMELLKLGKSAVYKLLGEGELTGFKSGAGKRAACRFYRSGVEKFRERYAKRTAPSPAPAPAPTRRRRPSSGPPVTFRFL